MNQFFYYDNGNFVITDCMRSAGNSERFFRFTFESQVSELKSGIILENRYEILGKIGTGGMAEVYLAKDLKLGKNHALKHIDIRRDRALKLQAFGAEQALLRRAHNHAFPAFIDAFAKGEHRYLVMEYIQGETLQCYLKRHKGMTLTDACLLLKDIMEALLYLHRMTPRVIYGDLKPANIMVQKGMHARLLDFGSVICERQRFLMGTFGYAAPEQTELDSLFPVDQRSDIYALGVILYEMLTGKEFSTFHYDAAFLPPFVRAFVYRCTRINPKERYQSMEEAITAIEFVKAAATEHANGNEKTEK